MCGLQGGGHDLVGDLVPAGQPPADGIEDGDARLSVARQILHLSLAVRMSSAVRAGRVANPVPADLPPIRAPVRTSMTSGVGWPCMSRPRAPGTSHRSLASASGRGSTNPGTGGNWLGKSSLSSMNTQRRVLPGRQSLTPAK